MLDVLPPFLDDLRLYEPDPNRPGEFTERRAGTDLPSSVREIPCPGFAFRLRQADATPRTFFLRLQTRSTSILAPRLWSPEQFAARSQLEYGLLFAILALLLTVIVRNVGRRRALVGHVGSSTITGEPRWTKRHADGTGMAAVGNDRGQPEPHDRPR